MTTFTDHDMLKQNKTSHLMSFCAASAPGLVSGGQELPGARFQRQQLRVSGRVSQPSATTVSVKTYNPLAVAATADKGDSRNMTYFNRALSLIIHTQMLVGVERQW